MLTAAMDENETTSKCLAARRGGSDKSRATQANDGSLQAILAANGFATMTTDANDNAWDDRFEAAIRDCAPLTRAGPIDADTSLISLGADSLTLVTLMIDLESAFGVVLPDSMLSAEVFSTPATLWSAFSELLGPTG